MGHAPAVLCCRHHCDTTLDANPVLDPGYVLDRRNDRTGAARRGDSTDLHTRDVRGRAQLRSYLSCDVAGRKSVGRPVRYRISSEHQAGSGSQANAETAVKSLASARGKFIGM